MKGWAFIVFDRRISATYRASAMRQLGWFLAGILSIPSTVWAQDSSTEPPTSVQPESSEPAAGDASKETPAAPAAGQTQVTEESPRRAARPDARRSDELGVQLRAVNATKLNDDDKKQNIETMLSKQRRGLALVTDLTADARARKDIVQLNCVNAKRTQLKGLLKLSQQAANTMFEGMATAAEDTVNHEYTKIAVASQRSQLLVTEAKQCVGEEAIFAGDTDVTVEISSDIPTTDPTLPAAPPLGPAAPPVASGF